MKFRWNSYGKEKNPKIKPSTLCNEYKNGGIKNVDVFSKVLNVQCS